ncbi:hypothetical protein Lepto7375DRAFT_6210 [Leptolyngbya sp. PCC 7375]|nr:hypothetical protein Lepto7375DRAFT_6210 [Leptolyngbya sp. PCC 7375]
MNICNGASTSNHRQLRCPQPNPPKILKTFDILQPESISQVSRRPPIAYFHNVQKYLLSRLSQLSKLDIQDDRPKLIVKIPLNPCLAM